MLAGTDLTRWAKLLALAGIAAHMTLVAFGNVTDYASNWAFVQHVLSMDTTFKSPSLMWRAVTNVAVQEVAYLLIILAEAVAALLMWWGFARLWQVRMALPADFHAAKGLALFALAWGFAIWVVGFMTIGGEWFAMWQSQAWNGSTAAARFFSMTGIVMIFVAMRE